MNSVEIESLAKDKRGERASKKAVDRMLGHFKMRRRFGATKSGWVVGKCGLDKTKGLAVRGR